MAGLNNSPLVSIIIVTFNSQKDIKTCLGALDKIEYPNYEIIVVDNNSSDDTLKVIAEFPSVRLVANKINYGYAKGNNLGVKQANGKLIAIINPDTFVTPSWLGFLVKELEQPNVVACQPKILLKSDKKLINCLGKSTNFLGFDYLVGYREKDSSLVTQDISSFSGSAVVMKKKAFEELGGFEEYFFMYYEDGDLSWRIRLSGGLIRLVPESVVYHDYKYQPDEIYHKTKDKFYRLERNRLLMILRNYSLKSIIMIFPAVLCMEVGMILYFLSKGWILEKPKEYWDILININKISQQRKSVQEVRKVNDAKLCNGYSGTVDFKEINNPLLKYIANPFFDKYWKIVKLRL